MTIVVGYSPSGQGRAALRAALRYAERSGEDLAIASHQYNDAATGMTAATEDEVRAELAEHRWIPLDGPTGAAGSGGSARLAPLMTEHIMPALRRG